MPRPNRRQPTARVARPAPRQPGPKTPVARTSAPVHVASAESLARLTVTLATRATSATFTPPSDSRPNPTAWLRDPALARISWVDRQLVIGAVRSLLRWWGWLNPLRDSSIETKLLYASVLDARHLNSLARLWAQRLSIPSARLVPLADAPDWTAKTDGFKRLVGGHPATVDPWRLFPDWFRGSLAVPPGSESTKVQQIRLIAALQTPAHFWMRAQGENATAVWDELRSIGVKPWIHRKWPLAARLDHEVELGHLPVAERAEVEVQDFGSQWVGHCADPHPGERWWVPYAERMQESIHLAALMQGRGQVVATHPRAGAIRALTLHARRTPFRNLSAKEWDERHVVGKAKSYDGVLVTPPSSAIGMWRRAPELRWLVEQDAPQRHAARQSEIIRMASAGTKPAGMLIYAVPTLTAAETTDVVAQMSEAMPEFKLKPLADSNHRDGTAASWGDSTDREGWFIARWFRRPKPTQDANLTR